MKSILERNRNGNGKSSLMYWWTDKQSLQPSAQTSLNVRDKKKRFHMLEKGPEEQCEACSNIPAAFGTKSGV